jgi:hypothetical protein
MRCTAKSKRSQERCRNHASVGRNVCHIHGGKTPIGPGSPHYRTGRHSRFLPSRIAADYEAALHDPELVSLRKEIATVDARIIDLLKRVETGESGATWRAAQAAMNAFDAAKARGQLAEMQLHLDRLKELLTGGAGDYAAWDKVMALVEQRRRLVDSEARRLRDAYETLTADRAMMLLAVVVEILQRHITDRSVLGAIAADVQRLTGPRVIEARPEGE